MKNRLLSVMGLVWIAGCGTSAPLDAAGSDASGVDAPEGEYIPAGFSRTPDLSAGGVHSFASAASVLAPSTDYAMVLETSAGRLVIDLFEADAPIAVNSFVFLARNHFFDGIAFHRVIAGFMAQTGDPNTLSSNRSMWGYGGAGYEFSVESTPANTFDGPGVVATANAGPTTNSSQFFITFVATPSLPITDYTIFGQVTEGLTALPSIVRGEPPATPSVIVRAYIVERAR